MSREIRFDAFDMNCVGHQSPDLWAHPRDRSWQYKDLEYCTELAQILQRGWFDRLFIADVLGVYDVFRGNFDAALRHSARIPVNDPLQLVPAMALVTERLGFGLAASLSFEHRYTFARRLSTLDHLTKGRAGWNIVTSYLDGGVKNIGLSGQTAHDDRYDVADEYLEVCFADPDKVWTVRELGEWFGVGGLGPLFVGGPQTVADLLEEWVEDTDVDGFNLAYAVTHETFADIVEHLAPELQKRGIYKKDYAPGVLREKLFGAGPRLPQSHPGARWRDLAGARRVLNAAE
jgi:alkanesulfonate monooxygenase SsuD/methylene tetrahydromethanopterin reductase-like flavin-dependent oxidoreductase (luciferase family)